MPEHQEFTATMGSAPFQVDLRGVVDLLGRTIYSTSRVFLRELLQNGVDAVRARAKVDPAAESGLLEIWPAAAGRPFRFRDNGVGLSAAEAAELLSTVGRSSKRDPIAGMRRQEYLGQFGIGLLSCFMVADRIVIRSRSATGAPPIEWVGDAAGSFSVRELAGDEATDMAVGTDVMLQPRHDDVRLLGVEEVRALARRFGEYLPVTVVIHDPDGSAVQTTHEPVFLDSAKTASAALMALGEELLGQPPLAVVGLQAPETQTRGVGFVLPFAPPPGARQASRVYLGRMLVSDRYEGLLPDWAFFVRCVLDTEGLAPTASREGFVEDEALARTREQLGAAVRVWVLREASRSSAVFHRFVATHGTGLKAVAAHDDELARILLPWLRFETSAGDLTIAEITRDTTAAGAAVRYVETVDEFRQIAPLVGVAASAAVVNAGYTYDAELLRRLPDLLGVAVSRISVGEVLDELVLPPPAEADAAGGLERAAARALADVGCTVSVRCFAPADLPGLCLVDADALRKLERDQAREVTGSSLWGGVLGGVAEAIEARRRDRGLATAASTQLCLNWASPVVRGLAGVDDPLVSDRTIKLLYVMAVLAAHRTLRPAERQLLTSALNDLVYLSVGLATGATATTQATHPQAGDSGER